MLTSRYDADAVIALYTANKPLNFEVPDWVRFENGQAIIYSDQNDNKPDVKYWAKSENTWFSGQYPAQEGEFLCR